MGPVVEQFPKPQLEQQTSLNKNEETSAIEFERMGDIETMSACYQLIKTVTQDEFVNPSNRQAEKNYTLTFNSQEVPYIQTS
ncbi:hypothetical protein [Methyloprofundus sp.]|uniref:hypothetical protein n=1 Tax=Methyloprofundus sp. TaxID=2020875 RepID=UPI003D09BF18